MSGSHRESKVVIITGASSGIGKGLAVHYATHGYRVGLIARRVNALTQLKSSLNSNLQENVMCVGCDVADKAHLFNAIKSIITKWGRVDILIANAGIGIASPAYNAPSDILSLTFNVNVLGAANAAYAVIPQMIAQKSGQIIGISSLAAYRGQPEAGIYCASKSALSTLFESMRLDLKQFGISVSIIKPGFIKTPLTDRNEFYMPFLLSVEKAVRLITRIIEKKQAIASFPAPLAILARSLYFWPVWLYDWCFSGRRNRKKDPDLNV